MSGRPPFFARAACAAIPLGPLGAPPSPPLRQARNGFRIAAFRPRMIRLPEAIAS